MVVLVIAAVVIVTAEPEASGDPPPFLVGVLIGFTVVSLTAMIWFRILGGAAVLDARSNAEIRTAYTRRMVVTSTLAITPALAGFALALATGHVGLFYGTFLVSIAALVFVAPRKGDAEALDRAMIRRGRPFRVSAAIEPLGKF